MIPTRMCLLALVSLMPFAALAEVDQGPKNAPQFTPVFANQTRAPDIGGDIRLATEIVASGLSRPWGVEVLPGGEYLVTERPGGLKIVRADGSTSQVAGAPEVFAERQGGLLDVALSDDFEATGRIFLTYSKPAGRGRAATAAATAVLERNPDRLSGFRDIYVQPEPLNSGHHFGSRIVLDGQTAYVTIGDRGRADARVQDLGSSNGKVLRITLDGGVPTDNPFRGQAGALGEVWSFGHRNPQGAAINPRTGDLWTLEHGPAGGDELNLIQKGANYGWPVVSYGVNYNGSPVGSGEASASGIVEPRYYWDPVIAPGGFAFYQGDLFDWDGDVLAASLNPGGLVRLRLQGDRVTGEARYLEDLGRVRDVEIDRDGSVLLLLDAGNGALVRVTPG